ncbi:MAG: hypothetical protein LBM70_04270 [Victivallales bacterium]|jgi:adenosylhomocysteinase|nr:hypothetical protein [Victivallales bacterium]
MQFCFLYREIEKIYLPEEYPALSGQIQEWKRSRPLEGMRIFDATPVFRNTMVKYIALLEAGATLTVGYGRGIPYDSQTVEILRRNGVEVVEGAASDRQYDVVLDCAGANADLKAKYGYVELTRSGIYRYDKCTQAVFLADDGRIKEIETALGTGDGFRRGMAHYGHGDFAGKKIVLFGCGKVGSGIVMYATFGGAKVTVIDDTRRIKPPFGASIVDLSDRAGIEKEIKTAWCVVSATGIRNALSGRFDPAILLDGEAIIANMGVEDEFGAAIPPERVLNRKEPLNFVLEEPTHLKYIDPTMALDNYGVLEVLGGKLSPGLNRPSKELEDKILNTVRSAGTITLELERLEKNR